MPTNCNAAKAAQKALGDNKAVPIPLESIVQAHGIKLLGYDLGEDTSGVLILEDNSATIGYNTKESKVRNRFTIAHELGHFCLHKKTSQGLFVDTGFKVMMFRGTNKDSDQKMEREANEFAACLLMPEDLLKAEIEKMDLDYTEDTIEVLAKKFEVSITAMTYRMSRLSL